MKPPSTRFYNSCLEALKRTIDYDKFTDEKKKSFDAELDKLPIDDDELRLHIKKNLPDKAQQIIDLAHKIVQEKNTHDDIDDDEVMQVLKSPDFLNRIKKEVGKRVVGEENAVHTTILVTAGGRITLNKAATSTNLCANAMSGTGKDIVTSAVIDLFPQENIAFKRTKLSPQSFTYWKRKEIKDGFSWDGKIVYLEDCSESLLNCDTFKTMSSGGSRATVVKDQMALDILINGKPVLIITTAEAEPNLESLRRFPLVYLDETTSQTEAIIERVARDAETDSIIEYDSVIMKALITLQPCHVIIPFALQIAEYFKQNASLQFRTHFKRILDYVKFAASIYQHQRSKDARGYIIAEWQDWDNSLPAIRAVTQSKLGFNLTHKQQKLLSILLVQVDWKTASQLLQLGTTYTKKGLYKALDKLTTFNVLETDVTEDERGHTVQKYKAKPNASMTVPTSQELQKPVHPQKDTQKTTIESVPSVPSVPEKSSSKLTKQLTKTDTTWLPCNLCQNTPCTAKLDGNPICQNCHDTFKQAMP